MKNFLKYVISISLSICLLAGCAKSVEQQVREQLELGNQYLLDLDYENAVVAFEKVIELEDRNPEAYLGLGQAYQGWAEQLLGEENEEGVELFEKALDSFAKAEELGAETEQVRMGQVASYQVLAQWHFNQADYQLAEDYCQEILKREPENGEAERILQDVHRETAETAPSAAEETQEAATGMEPPDSNEIYSAYYNKLMELQAQYGEAGITEQNGDMVLTGLCLARLIDFDGDGLEELILAYNDGVPDEWGWPVFTLEIWGYVDAECLKLFETQDGLAELYSTATELSLFSLEGKYYFVQSFSENGAEGSIDWGLEDGIFVQSMVYQFQDTDGSEKAWIDGTEVPMEELRNLWNQGEFLSIGMLTDYATTETGNLDKTVQDLQATYHTLSAGERQEENFILGTWETELSQHGDSFNTEDYTTFYADGSVGHKRYRSNDEGTYQITGENTAVAIFTNNMLDDPSVGGYRKLEGYQYTVTYQYDQETNILYADYSSEFEEAVSNGLVPGGEDSVLYKVD